MSQSPSSLQQRQRLHQRQNSTPVASEVTKVPIMPQTQHRPANLHRRGHSFDQRSPIRRQHPGMVSITNIGSIQRHGQQILREAQQQRTPRPGQPLDQQQQQQQFDIPPGSPHCGVPVSMPQHGPGMSYDNLTTMNAIMYPGPPMQVAHSPYHMQDMNVPMLAGIEGYGMPVDENSMHYFNPIPPPDFLYAPPYRRQSHPDLQIHTAIRPITPTHQMHGGEQSSS